MYRHSKANKPSEKSKDREALRRSSETSQSKSQDVGTKAVSVLANQTLTKLPVKDVDSRKRQSDVLKLDQDKEFYATTSSSNIQKEQSRVKRPLHVDSVSHSLPREKELITQNPKITSKSVAQKLTKSSKPEGHIKRSLDDNRQLSSNSQLNQSKQNLHVSKLPSSQLPDIIKSQQDLSSGSSNILTPISLDENSPAPQMPEPPPPPPPPPPQLPLIQEGSSSDVESSQTSEPVLQPAMKFPHEQHKLQFGQSDLLNQKRMLKKVDRKAEYNPVTLARKELFEDEYAKQGDTPPEYLPLHIVKPVIVSQNISADLVTLNLNGIDQLTDYLFPLLHGGGSTPVGHYSKVKKILLVGCINLTDQGLIWIARLFPELQMIEINACRKVTEKGLHHIFMCCRNLQNVNAMAINTSLIPDSIMLTKIPIGSFQWAGCPIISQGKEYYTTYHGTGSDSYFESHKRKLLILRDKSVKEEIIPLLTKNEMRANSLFHYQKSFQVPGIDSSSSSSLFNMFEIAANSPLQDNLVSEGTIVMISYSLPGGSDHLIETADRIADIISAIVIKCPDVMFLLVEMSTNSSIDSISGLIKARLQFLANTVYTATYKLYTRNWHLEYLDYKGQQGLGWGIASYDALESLVNPEENRMMTVCVTKENFSTKVTSALSKCSMDIKKHVPWVHCEWSKELETIIKKIPNTAVKSQTSLFHETDMEARTQHHKRYSFPRLGKLISLLKNWGEALYFWHEHKSMCVTDIQAYENILIKFLSCKPPDKVKINFLGGEISCWKLSTIEFFIQNEQLEVKALDFVALLKHQGILLLIPEHHIDDGSSGSKVFVRTDDVPDGHEILNTLWPEPCHKQRILQTDRCYNFLPTIPPGLMPKLLRTLVKVYKPLYIWKTGFLLRQGPVDIKASLFSYNGANLDKTPVLLLSARVVDLRMSTSCADSSDAQQSTHEPRNVMFSCLRQVMALLDFVYQKTKVYTCITLPCPECAEFTREGIFDTVKTCHFSYYIALAGRHRSCKKHKSVTASFLTDVHDEKGEALGPIIPLHNYPYQIAASAILDEVIKAEHYRPMDPVERCFYCGSCEEAPCLHCLMCSLCTKQFSKFAKFVEPGHITSRSFKLQLLKDGELADDERIISNTKGCVYYYKKGHCMQLHQAMVPFYMDEIFITILKGASFFLNMTFGTGKKLGYDGHAATVIDQEGHAHQNEKWRSRDTNLISIRLESVEIGKRVRVVICLRGLEVHSEEVDGWQMKLEIISEKAGIYIIHVPGMKASWYTNDHSFTVGSSLEMIENEHTTHPAIIMEKTSEGYLTLDVNGVVRQHVFSSPQLMPTGTAVAMGSTLASVLPSCDPLDGKISDQTHVPAWAFLMFQVPCGFEALIKSSLTQGTNSANELKREGMEKDLLSLICSCTTLYFPSVWHGKQILLRDKVEQCLFTDGKWNFSMAALLMLPSTLTRDDLKTCSQTMFTENFKLHPLCQFRGDVNTVMSSGPTVPQIKTIECFHCVHMLDNVGFEMDTIKLDEAANLGRNILWAWSLMLLRLQHNKVPALKTLTNGIQGIEHLPNAEISEGIRQVIQAMNHALFLSLGRDFDFKSSLNEQACEQWRDLMLTQGETQSLVKVKPVFLDETLLMCESHQASWQINMGHTHFTGVPGPYGHFIYSLNISGNSLTELQTELFTNLPNLKDLNLSCNKLVSLSSDICKCTQLTTLSLGENLLKELPSTLEQCKDIFRLDIDKNYFDEFPAVIVKLKNLKRLYAQFLRLRSLPDNFGDLCNLETLSLSGNCFTSLPHSFCELQKLINLSLNGVMWMKPCNTVLLSKENFEEFLKTNNLHLWLNRHKKDKSAIFSFFDEDTNGTLDQKEIGKLNATMFYAFPRFGYMGKEPPNDDTPSGFPEVLCELKKLQYLSLQYHGIVTIPESINKMTNLHTLHLGNNPNLLAISANAGSLPLKRIEVENCPRLKTPPKEITAKGFLATSAYLKRLLSGSVSCQRTKLMLVGLGGAGKSSLVKALLSDNKKVQLTVEEEITDGIEICPWTVSTKEGNITYSVWDFAGQTVYYNTHQFFLSDRAVYLLIWNIRLGHEHAGLGFWLSSITVHAPKAPIFVVGTHVDQESMTCRELTDYL